MSSASVSIGNKDPKEIKCCLSNIAYTITSSRFSLGFFPGGHDEENIMKIVGTDTVLSKINSLFSGVQFREEKKVIVSDSILISEAKEFFVAIAVCLSGHTHPLSFPLSDEDGVIRVDGDERLIGKIKGIVEGIKFVNVKEGMTSAGIIIQEA